MSQWSTVSIFLLFIGIFILLPLPHVFKHDVDSKVLTYSGCGQFVSLLVPDNTYLHLTHNKVTTSLNLLDLKDIPKLPSYMYYQIKSAFLKKCFTPFMGCNKALPTWLCNIPVAVMSFGAWHFHILDYRL